MTGHEVFIHWDRVMLQRFIKATKQAEQDGVDVFTFDGHEFVVSYAKYLIEYLHKRLSS